MRDSGCGFEVQAFMPARVPQGSAYDRIEVELATTESLFQNSPDFQSHLILFVEIARKANLADVDGQMPRTWQRNSRPHSPARPFQAFPHSSAQYKITGQLKMICEAACQSKGGVRLVVCGLHARQTSWCHYRRS